METNDRSEDAVLDELNGNFNEATLHDAAGHDRSEDAIFNEATLLIPANSQDEYLKHLVSNESRNNGPEDLTIPGDFFSRRSQNWGSLITAPPSISPVLWEENTLSHFGGEYSDRLSSVQLDNGKSTVKVSEYRCDMQGCGKAYKTLNDLKHHRRYHTPYDQRKIVCDKCGRRFLFYRELQIHTGARRLPPKHNCEKCGKKFVRYDSLTRHQKMKCNPIATEVATFPSGNLPSIARGHEDTVLYSGNVNFLSDLQTENSEFHSPRSAESSSQFKLVEPFDSQFPPAVPATECASFDGPPPPPAVSISPTVASFELPGVDYECMKTQTDEGYASYDSNGTNLHVNGMAIDADMQSQVTDNRDIGFGLNTKRTLLNSIADDILLELEEADRSIPDHLVEELPNLLLWFSQVLDTLSTSSTYRQASIFIRHHRNNIARRVDSMRAEKACRPNDEVEKVNITDWMENVSGTKDSNAECPDDKLILEDEAVVEATYNALPDQVKQALASLRGGSSFEWLVRNARLAAITEGGTSGSIYWKIRQQLLQIRRSRRFVKLCLDWRLKDFALQCGVVGDISSALVYIGEGDTLESVTCATYLERTWFTIGTKVAAMLKTLVGSMSSERQLDFETHFGGVRVRLRTSSDGKVKIGIIGDMAPSIQVAEALIWLGAACNICPNADRPMYCVPNLQLDDITDFEIPVTYSFNGLSLSDDKSLKDQYDCWVPLLRNPTITPGYPISRRYHGEKGLEMSTDVMVALSRATRATIFDGTTVLKGFCNMLVAVAQHSQSLLWHYILSPERRPIPYTHASTLCGDQKPAVLGSHLPAFRHFVGWTQVSRSRIGTTMANYEVDYTGPNFADRGCALEGVTIGFQQWAALTTNIVPGNRDTPLKYSSHQEYEMQIDHATLLHVVLYDCTERRAWLVDGREALLYLSRSFIQSRHALPAREGFSQRLVREFSHRALKDGRLQTAREVLLAECNRKIEVYKHFTFEKLVSRFYEDLQEMHDHHLRLQTAQKWHSANLRKHVLEGWGFADIVSMRYPLKPRVAKLTGSGRTWSRLVNTIGTVNILGAGFGDIIEALSDCKLCVRVPRGHDLLACRAALLEDIASFRGTITGSCIEIVKGICWNRPNDFFATKLCGCRSSSSKCGRRILVLESWAATSNRMKPGLAEELAEAAVIIGRECDTQDVSGLQLDSADSGLGSSISSESTVVGACDISSPGSTATPSDSRDYGNSASEGSCIQERRSTNSMIAEDSGAETKQPVSHQTLRPSHPDLSAGITAALANWTIEDLERELERRKRSQVNGRPMHSLLGPKPALHVRMSQSNVVEHATPLVKADLTQGPARSRTTDDSQVKESQAPLHALGIRPRLETRSIRQRTTRPSPLSLRAQYTASVVQERTTSEDECFRHHLMLTEVAQAANDAMLSPLVGCASPATDRRKRKRISSS